jgi:tripartite-type tricarboxylate transporter receptor subunit TctC
MNTQRRTLFTMLGLAAFAPRAISAEPSWPGKPVHIVVAGGTGGVIDIRARWLAERLSPLLAQPVLVENHGGAGGNIGTAAVAHSAADGYTLLFVHQGTMAINPHLYARAGYDPLADFAPITRVGVGPLLLTVNRNLHVQSVADLVQLAKSRPEAMNYGSPGIGTPPHLASELFKRAAGIQATHVPYKGGGALMTDLLGGQLTWSMDGMNAQLPHVTAGRLRALAVTGPRRLQALPEVPTMAEAGVPGYEYVSWSGLAAPAHTPKPVIAELYAETSRILASAEAMNYFASFGLDVGGEPPEEFASFIRAEYSKWGAVIRDAGIRLE